MSNYTLLFQSIVVITILFYTTEMITQSMIVLWKNIYLSTQPKSSLLQNGEGTSIMKHSTNILAICWTSMASLRQQNRKDEDYSTTMFGIKTETSNNYGTI